MNGQDSFPGEERHARLSLSTDASNSGWDCAVHDARGDQSLGDNWSGKERELNISSNVSDVLCPTSQSKAYKRLSC